MSPADERPDAGSREPDDDLDAPKADRPGGPGQEPENPAEPGDATPGPDPEDQPGEDDATRARREHLRDKG